MIEYRDFGSSPNRKPVQLYINKEKSGIDMTSSGTRCYSTYTGRSDQKIISRAGKGKLYERIFNPRTIWYYQDRYFLVLARTTVGVEYIVGYRLLFKKEGEQITPLVILDDDGGVHVQADQLMDKLETGFMKLILNSDREVILHDTLAKDFFHGPDYKFNTLAEKKAIEEQLTIRLGEYVQGIETRPGSSGTRR